jgi:hypothetical protein
VAKKEKEQWYVFLTSYWVPFPTSEYGGLQAVVARNAQEAAAFLEEQTFSWELSSINNARELIEARLRRATVLPLAEEYENAFIAKEFVT